MDKTRLMDTAIITGQGATGAGMVELVHQIPAGTNTVEIIKIIMQGIITLFTMYGIGRKVRRKKKDTSGPDGK